MNEQDHPLPIDYLETMSPANPGTPDVPEESPSAEYDAGLDNQDARENDWPSPGEVLEDNMREYSRQEIPVTDLPDAPREDTLHSPELADMNVPGEIDIEDLDEDAARDALPPDARLDRRID